jgi:hypothetical protein
VTRPRALGEHTRQLYSWRDRSEFLTSIPSSPAPIYTLPITSHTMNSTLNTLGRRRQYHALVLVPYAHMKVATIDSVPTHGRKRRRMEPTSSETPAMPSQTALDATNLPSTSAQQHCVSCGRSLRFGNGVACMRCVYLARIFIFGT